MPWSIDERGLPLHGRPQAHIVAMIRIRTAIAIAEEPAVDEPVVVGALAVLDRRCGSDGEGQFGQDGWLEDPLRTDQGDSDAFEVETTFQDGTRDGGFAEASPLLGEEVESAQADHSIDFVSHGGQGRVERFERVIVRSWAFWVKTRSQRGIAAGRDACHQYLLALGRRYHFQQAPNPRIGRTVRNPLGIGSGTRSPLA